MNPNEINKLKEKAPFPLMVMFVLLFLPAFILQPEQELVKENSNKFDSLLKSARTNIKRRFAYNRENGKFKTVNEIMSRIDGQLPESSELPQIIDKINEVAEKNSVLLENVNYRFNEKFDDLSIPSFSITMNLNAYYENMRRFIAEIEDLSYPLMVSEVVVSAGKTYTITLKQMVK